MRDGLARATRRRTGCAQGPRCCAKLLWRLPDRLQPQIKPVVWAVAFDPDSGDVVAGLRTEHPSFGMVTGLVEAGDRLWMGCIGCAGRRALRDPGRADRLATFATSTT